MEDKTAKTMLAKDVWEETMDTLQVLSEMTPEERKEILLFMQGVRFAKGIRKDFPKAV